MGCDIDFCTSTVHGHHWSCPENQKQEAEGCFLNYCSDVGRHGLEWGSWLGWQHSRRRHSFAIQVPVVIYLNPLVGLYNMLIFCQQFRKQIEDDGDTGVNLDQPWGVDWSAEYGRTIHCGAHRKTGAWRNCQLASFCVLKIRNKSKSWTLEKNFSMTDSTIISNRLDRRIQC